MRSCSLSIVIDDFSVYLANKIELIVDQWSEILSYYYVMYNQLILAIVICEKHDIFKRNVYTSKVNFNIINYKG